MKRTHRLLSLLLSILMLVSLLPVTAFAEETTQAGKAKLIGFAAGQEAGDAYIQNNGMTILDATGTGGQNPIYYGDKVGQTAILSPYTPYGLSAFHPGYEYNDYSATAIVVQNESGSGTQRRLLKNDTFQPGVTYRFTFQDTLWPVNGVIKGGGYLGELAASDFTISGASVEKVERVTQQIDPADVENSKQGFFYNVWIKIDGTQNDYAVQYARNNVTVAGLDRPDTSPAIAKTGYAKEGTKITLTAEKSKTVENGEKRFFTGWKFTTTDNNKFYMEKDYIQWYCNVTEYTSNESGSDKVTCSFRMGDKPLKVEALYGKPGSAGVGNVTFNNIKLWVMPPIKGAKGVTAVVPEFDELGTTYQIRKVEWLEDNETGAYNYLCMDSNKTFDTANKCYTMRVMLKLKDGYAFSDKNGVTITINGKTYGTGTENTLYNEESRKIPVTYDYSEANKSLAIYIPAGGDGVKTRLEDRYKAQAALVFVDAPSIEVTVTDASGHSYGKQTKSDFTMALEQGINYDIQVKVRVPQAIQTAIDSGLMQILPQFRYLMNSADMGTNLWQGSQVTDSKDGSDTIYTYSTNFSPVAGESYKLVFGTDLVTTGADALRIAGNIISGTFNCVNTKITDGPTVTGNALKAGAISGPVLTVADNALYTVGDTVTSWDISEGNPAVNGKTYWTMICLNPKPGYVFDPGHDYKPDVKLGGAAAKTNYAVAVDGSAMFLTVYATATHEHKMGYEQSTTNPSMHVYCCTVDGCNYAERMEPHDWGAGVLSEDGKQITYTCKCGKKETEEVSTTIEPNNIYGFKANVTTPKAGETVGAGTNWVTVNEKFTPQLSETTVEWKKKDDTKVLGRDDTFEAGQEYTITVTFTAAEGYKFYENKTFNVLWNSDVKPDALQTYGEGSKTVTQSMTFTVKQSVAVTVAMPGLKAGDTLPALTIDPADKLDTTGYCSASVARAGKTTVYQYKYAASAWKWYEGSDEVEKIPLQAGDEVAYWWNFNPTGDNVFNMTVNSEGATNLTTIYSLPTGTILASYTIPTADDPNAISKVALTVSGYEYGENVSAAAVSADPANVTTGALNWNPNDTTFGAKAYTVTIPVTPADGCTFASGCLFTVNGYLAAYDEASRTVTCTLPKLHTHDFGSWTNLNDAVHYHTCKTEGCVATEMKAHNWEKAGEVEATTTTTGSITYKCNDCGAEKTETTPKLPETVDPGKPDQPTRPTQPERPNRRPGSGSGTGSTTKPNKDVKSGNTGDAGIALYAGLALLSVTGGAWTFSRKRKENDK